MSFFFLFFFIHLGDEILKVMYKSVGPFSEPQNVTVVEKFTAGEGESITFTQFNSSKVSRRSSVSE